MRVDVICEGSTDFAVLRVVLREVFKGTQLVITSVQPDFDALRARHPGTPAPGWTGVRAYLQSPASAVVAVLSDVLVVQVDADVRRASQVEKKLRDAAADEHELDPLCNHVKSWFAEGPPPSVVVVLPRDATEAWILAARTRVTDVESDPAPASTLITKGLLAATERGDANKQSAAYEELAGPLVGLIGDKKRLARVPELARFVQKLRARAHALRRAARSSR